MKRNDFTRLFAPSSSIKCGQFLYTVAVLLALLLFHFEAHAREGGQIIREARCKVVIQGPLNASVGDIFTVTRRPRGMGSVVGAVRISQATPEGDFTAAVIGSRGNCRKFLFAYIKKIEKLAPPRGTAPVQKPLVQPLFENRAVPPISQRHAEPQPTQTLTAPPSFEKMTVAVGFGGANTNLKGVSRATALEDYPLVLGSLNIEAGLYPFAFVSGGNPLLKGIGLEGEYRLTSSLSDVQVSTPSAVAGAENKLGVGVKRSELRAGAAMRVPLLANRLLGQVRLGYYRSSIASVLNKFEAPAGSSAAAVELSPLRDLRLSGIYTFGGIIFQPVSSFKTQLSVGTLFAADYTVDNRVQDSPKSSPVINANVTDPSVFFFDAHLGYMLFKYMQVGVDLSVNTSRGKAIFPDGLSRAPITELYFFYGLSVALVL